MWDDERRPRRQPLNSLATKIILLVFVCTFVTASAVSWISIESTRASLLGVIDRLYPATVEQTALRLSTWLLLVRNELGQLGRDPALSANGPERQRRLGAALRSTPNLQGLALLDVHGNTLALVGTGLQHLERRALGAATASLAALRTLPGETDGERAVAMVVAPASHGGAIVGALARGEIEALLARGRPTSSHSMALVDPQGRVLGWVGPSEEPPAGPFDIAATDGNGPAVREYANADGVQVIGAAHPVGLGGWRVALEAPYADAFEPLVTVVTRIFLVDVFIILLFSVAAYRVTATVVKPVEVLSEAAGRIARGQTDLEIPEPVTRDEIGLLARAFNDMMRRLRRNQAEIETANRHLQERNAELQTANEVLNQLSITDGLTKLHNHRFFQDHLTREIKRVGRSGEPLSLLLIDIDDFKQLNDRLGHAAGDEILVGIAGILDASVRESDLLARYGGEEFVVLASGTDVRGACRLGEKIRTSIAETSFVIDDSMRPLRITVSIGVAQFGGNRKRFFQNTDQALYRAKASGKNCVVADEDDLDRAEAAQA